MPAAPHDNTTPAGRAVDRFDLEIVEFVLRWAPYGGPPADECLPRFGLSRDRLQARFQDIVRSADHEHLDAEARALLEGGAMLLTFADDDGGENGDDAEAPQRRADPSPRPIGEPVLRRGVWRWV